MSQFTCTCGHVISDVHHPSPAEGVLFSEASLEQFLSIAGAILADLKKAESEDRRLSWIKNRLDEGYPDDASDSELIEDLLSRQVNDLAVSTVRCESCGRLHVQEKSGSNDYISFAQDAGFPG